jgi:hypothetical protein
MNYGRPSLAAESRVRAQVGPCRICSGKMALGQVFLQFLRLSPVNIIPPGFHIHHLGITGLLVAAVEPG